MNCSEVQDLLSAYHDHELANDQRSRLAAHLGECSDCAKKLHAYEALSSMAADLSTPSPPKHIWRQLERQLEQQHDDEQQAKRIGLPSGKSSYHYRSVAVAVTLLVAIGLGWISYQSWFAEGRHDQFTLEFGHYLEEFQRDPDVAQQFLLTKYENQLVDPSREVEGINYRPAVANGLPEGYRLKSTHVMKMPCCTCVQSICKRSDGSTLAIFEHDDEETTEWFGERPEITATCNERRCSLVQLDSQIAASWKRGSRHITLIGVRETEELSNIVESLAEEERRPAPN